MKDSGVEWIGKIPESWNTCRLKNFAQIMNGADYKEIQDDKGKYPVIGSGGEFARANSYLYDGESVLLGRKGTVDKPRYIRGAFWTVDTMYYTEVKPICSPKYLYYLCTQIQFEYYQYGSAVPSMTQRDLNSIVFPFPILDEQRRIVDYLDSKCSQIDSTIASQETIINRLKEYKVSIITEAVTKGLGSNELIESSDIKWVGCFPNHWNTYRVANLYEQTSEPGLEELPILTVSINSGISDRELEDDEKDRVFVRSEDRTKYKRVRPGDLAYNMMRAWQGAFGAVRVDGMVSPAYVTCRPKPGVEIDTRYIEYLFRTPIAIEEMHRYSHGVADFRLRLYWPEFKNIRLCLPPIQEQVEIADYIDKKSAEIDATIEKRQRMISKLQEYKKSLIYEVVTGKKEI